MNRSTGENQGYEINRGDKLFRQVPVQHNHHQYFSIPPFIPELESLSKSQLKNLNENEGDIKT